MEGHKQPDQLATAAFSAQAPVFDKLYGNDPAIQYKRNRVRQHMDRFLGTASVLLELNCGTGEDALYFAGKGFNVTATDGSSKMLEQCREKIRLAGMQQQVHTKQSTFEELTKNFEPASFDYIFSNFGGLNCTGKLKEVLEDCDRLLRPGGRMTLVIISGFCLWELLLVFKGKFRTAFRRFFASGGRSAKVEGKDFSCWYYSTGEVQQLLGKKYRTLTLEGLCSLVPPSYIEGFGTKYPALNRRLITLEEKYAAHWPFRSIGDYFILTLEKIY